MDNQPDKNKEASDEKPYREGVVPYHLSLLDVGGENIQYPDAKPGNKGTDESKDYRLDQPG